MQVARRGGIGRMQVGMCIDPDHPQLTLWTGHSQAGNGGPRRAVVATDHHGKKLILDRVGY